MKFDGGSRGTWIMWNRAVLYKNNEIWSTSEIVSKHNTNTLLNIKH